VVQAVHTSLPLLLEAGEQVRGTAHGTGTPGDALRAAVPALGHQLRALQHGYVLLHRGKRHIVVRREFADGRVRGHHTRQYVAPRRIGKGAEQLVQRSRCRLFIYNHLVVDSSTIAGGLLL
jgi:hypothetical protein